MLINNWVKTPGVAWESCPALLTHSLRPRSGERGSAGGGDRVSHCKGREQGAEGLAKWPNVLGLLTPQPQRAWSGSRTQTRLYKLRGIISRGSSFFTLGSLRPSWDRLLAAERALPGGGTAL